MSGEERSSAKNGIWMCKLHGTAVDSGDPKFTVELLRDWKARAEERSNRAVLYSDAAWPAKISEGDLSQRLREAATADINVLRRSKRWPSTDISLAVRMKELDQPIQASALARALSELGDLVLVAPPGMGKTSTLLQAADGIIAHGETAIFVSLADWATENKTLLDSVLTRVTFRGRITEDELRTAAQNPGVFLLLDGWNELAGEARRRVTAELHRLQADLPELGLFISTRKQSLDVPFEGTVVDLLPLGDTQQMAIARTLRGQDGERIVDEAWRTPGVRDLVSIPLYLTSLLSLPSGQPFPKTKEEVLRRFVEAHEQQADHAEALRAAVKGLQTMFLSGLAVTATHAGSPSIPEDSARRSIARTDEWLYEDGQLAIKLETSDVLDALVSHHVLVRTGEPTGYSFQHQQFQEWYASTHVERAILESVSKGDALGNLKADILNETPWEEAILFAVERMARGDEQQRSACSNAILAAFDVDPILAAEMISRATDTVWALVSTRIQNLVRGWHTPGKLDRSVRFMITSGRAEFRDLIWPLIASEDDQKSLPALRAARRFRPSVLGPDAAEHIRALPIGVRKTVVSEMGYSSGIDGLDLAALIAKTDHNPELKAAAVGAMSFRRADRHVVDVLSTAGDDTFDLISRKHYFEEIDDTALQARLKKARARTGEKASAYDRLWTIVYARDGEDFSAEITDLVATIDIEGKRDAEVALIYEARKRYEPAIAQGLLKRLREGRELFYGADDILAASGIILEDDVLVDIALIPQERLNGRSDAAASVLGPIGVGKLVDARAAVFSEMQKLGRHEQRLNDRYYGLRDRIDHAPGVSVLSAIRERAEVANNEEICELARLLCRREEIGERARPFPQDLHADVAHIVERWANRLIASGDNTKRIQLAAVAEVVSKFPSAELLPVLKRLLDDELRRYRAFYQQAEQARWQGDAANEARNLHTNAYQQAFSAIKAPETTALLISYLQDHHFGETAALILKVQWIEANDRNDTRSYLGTVDFTGVEEKRAARAVLACDEADAIFEAIAPLIVDGATEEQKKHAIRLAIQAARLPHDKHAEIIRAVLSISPQALRAKLLLNLVLLGEIILVDVVQAGINEILEEAKKHTWMLYGGGWDLKAWLLLIPFTDRPLRLVDTLTALPPAQRTPDFLVGMIRACDSLQLSEIEEVLFKLAETDPSFYADHEWRKVVRKRSTLTSGRRYFDLILEGKVDARDGMGGGKELKTLLSMHPDLRAYAYALLKEGTSPRIALLAEAVAEVEDPEGLLLLVELEKRLKRPLIPWHSVRGAITEQVPSQHWQGAFEVMPVAATELRRKLLAMTTDGGPTDAAARVLRIIDSIRDESGAPQGEPRHPDLVSGKPWPIIASTPSGVGS